MPDRWMGKINSLISQLTQKANKPSGIISLPARYRLVVGDTFELFFRGILRVGNINNYNIFVSCSKGKAYSRRYIFTPEESDIGTHALTVTVKDDTGAIIDTKSTSLVVRTKAVITSIPADDGSHNLLYNAQTQIGYWANTVTGVVGVAANYSVTNEMPVTAGETYQCNPYVRNVIFYDASHNYHSTSSQTITSIVIPAGVAYARCNYMSTTPSTTRVFVKGTSAPTGYVETYEESIADISSGGNVLCIGDSLTAAGVWVEEFYRRLSASGGTPEGDNQNAFVFIGTAGTTPKYEGTGGWYYTDYLGSSSPFYVGGVIDFSAYATAKSVESIDYVHILLGWNGSTVAENICKGQVRDLIDAIRDSFPSAKINLIGIQVGSKDGMGDDYGATWDWYEKTQYVFNYGEWLEDVAGEYTGVYYTQLSGQFDSEYNMPVSSMAVNARNSVTISTGTNGVHPYSPGYYQIADAAYRTMHHMLTD